MKSSPILELGLTLGPDPKPGGSRHLIIQELGLNDRIYTHVYTYIYIYIYIYRGFWALIPVSGPSGKVRSRVWQFGRICEEGLCGIDS